MGRNQNRQNNNSTPTNKSYPNYLKKKKKLKINIKYGIEKILIVEVQFIKVGSLER